MAFVKKILVLLLSLFCMQPLFCLKPAKTIGASKDMEDLKQWRVGSVVSSVAVGHFGIDRCFTVSVIPDNVFARMQGKSYPKGCPIARSQLRYLRLLHVDKEGRIKMGEMICNKAIAAEVLAIFRELYNKKYPIESVRLIDDFNASDEQSMRANNSSCFCYREVKGSGKLSAHARGMAIDINTLYNPYYHRSRSGKITIQPATAKNYLDRNAKFPYKIVRGDLAWQLFTAHGFQWGGTWRRVKDYQHFEK